MGRRSRLSEARSDFHASVARALLFTATSGVPSNADKHNGPSISIAKGIARRIGAGVEGERLQGQTSGQVFEELCCGFVEETFRALAHLRPGSFHVERPSSRRPASISVFEQYSHLARLQEAADRDRDLAVFLGSDYIINPDVVIYRDPEDDSAINAPAAIVDEAVARCTGLRSANNSLPLLHASISCKWTIRSDRAQNSRSEALNLVRNRKGRAPHVVVITGEPTPSRIASIALGTGDIDCVYHFALLELRETLQELDLQDSRDLLQMMVDGKRLRDIADLPLDLTV